LSHQLEKIGLGKAFHYKTPAAVFEEIRKAVSGYNVQPAGLLTARRGSNARGIRAQRPRAL